MLLSALAVSTAKSFGLPLVLITVAERAVGFYCVADRLPGSIRTMWSLTENRPIVKSLLQYLNQLRLDISGQHDFHFDK